MLDICGGAAGPVCEASAALPQRNPVRLRAAPGAILSSNTSGIPITKIQAGVSTPEQDARAVNGGEGRDPARFVVVRPRDSA